uniref:TNFR-Cys domain-containing protein n=1 Tax=Ciona savignyi TaxID=51511 RepID=H2ZPZ3_CIOSA
MRVSVLCVVLVCSVSCCHAIAPSIGLLKRAWCACMCCEDKAACYKDSSIPADYECESTTCTESFCEQWGRARCKTSCFCAKCKSSLDPTDNRCINYDSVLLGCSCPDPDTIECPTEASSTDPAEPEELKDAKKTIESIKETAHCIVPCFCSICKDGIPPQFQQKCASSGLPAADCDCSSTNCPTQAEIERFEQLAEEASNIDLEGELEDMKEEAKKIKKETDEINENLKDEIAAGRTKPILPAQLKTTKCNLQCICDECRDLSVSMEESCSKVLPERVDMCPKCPDNIECPKVDSDAQCKMNCFCKKCMKDSRMPEKLYLECTRVRRNNEKSCPDECSEEPDCSTLDQLVQPNSSGEVHKDVKKGKLKEKKRMWDEL